VVVPTNHGVERLAKGGGHKAMLSTYLNKTQLRGDEGGGLVGTIARETKKKRTNGIKEVTARKTVW